MVTELMIASHFLASSAAKIDSKGVWTKAGLESQPVSDFDADVVVVADRLAELDGDLWPVFHVRAVGQPAGRDEARGRRGA